MSFRKFLKTLEEENEIKHVEKEVSTKYEVAKILANSEKAVKFENIQKHDMKIAGNVYGSRERISKGLQTTPNELIKKMRNSLTPNKKPKTVSDSPVKETIIEETNLKKLPILKHFGKDGGPYITSSILVAKDFEGNRNLSFHRLQLISKNRLAIRLVPRDLYKIFKEAEEEGESLEVAAFLGSSPAVALASATSPPYGVDEYNIAASLGDDLELVECSTVNLKVPANAEIVLEGKLVAGERVEEGPFADITGTYDAVREQPVFEVESIMRREDAIYQALLPSSSEHRHLMGIPKEPLILEEVDEITQAEDVYLTPGGCGWLHSIISINKQDPKDGKKAIEAAFEAHPSVKHVVVVDEDINVYDSDDVEGAIATRSRADEDVLIKSEIEGSSLDPTADPETRKGSKMGIDATKPSEDFERFEKANIPD